MGHAWPSDGTLHGTLKTALSVSCFDLRGSPVYSSMKRLCVSYLPKNPKQAS